MPPHNFDVDRILGRRISLGSGTEYLVLWLEYTLADSSWEPSNLLNCGVKLQEFERRCFELRVAQQGQLDVPAVDNYSNHGIVTLVDEGHEFMMDSDSGFEAPPEDFDFWNDQARSWEAPSAFIQPKEIELVTQFGNSQFAYERKHLGIELLTGSTAGKSGIEPDYHTTTKFGMAAGSSSRGGNSGEAARWFNLKSSTLAPKGSSFSRSSPTEASRGTPVAVGRQVLDSSDEEEGSSSDSDRALIRGVKRRRTRATASASSDSGVETPLTRRMAQLCSPPGSEAYVALHHGEGEALWQLGITRSVSQRIERERRFAKEALQRAATTPTPPRAGVSDVVAHGRVARRAEPPVAAPAREPTPPPARRITERQECCICQLDVRADKWACVECGLCFHRNCYQSLVTRLGADPEYLSALDDYCDDDDFVCRFCSLHSRRTPQQFLTWRGTTSSDRVNMQAVDFLVKWKGVAYRHLDWVPFVWLNAQPDFRKKCVSLKLMVIGTPEPPLLENTFKQEHLVPAGIIGVKPCTANVSRQRLAKLREDPPVGVPEDMWGLYTGCESVWVVWRSLNISEATWEAPPNPNDAGSDYHAWHAEYVAWQQAENVSLQRQLQLAKKSRRAGVAEFKQQPEFIRGGTLYPYQLEGANWMWQKWNRQQSFVLADEMGLGKTVQVISFLLMIFHSTLPTPSSDPNYGTFPFLIVVPSSLVSNWAQELRTWAPELVVAQLSGIAGDREIELEHSIFRRASGTKRRDLRCHVVLASYEAVGQQAGIRELTSCITWQVIVYDEGHRLRNSLTKTYKALSVFNARMRAVLTGTPMQNDLQELFNVLSFIDPDNKRMLDKLKDLLGDGSSADVASVGEPLTKYFLRRTKANVPCLVPAKHEVFVPVSMTCLQRELYRATLSKNVQLLQSIAVALHRDRQGGAGDRVGSKSLNNVLLEVRQIVSHPYLLDNVEPAFDSKEETQAQLIAAGGKLRFLHALLPELRRRGHRVLVFTQFKRTLDVLEDYLAGEGIGCVRIDGDTPPLLRQAVVNEFNEPGSPLLVFLASTRTGGTGLNLTSANVVIIYDCDFNPQADVQAIGRAHRIGQSKPVIVLKLVTENSAEERIVRRATNKLLLSQKIVGSLSGEKPAEPVAAVPQIEMEADLRCDARTLFDEAAESHADDRAIVYDSKRVVALLDQCQAELAAEGARLAASGAASGSAAGVSRVWAMNRDGRLDDVAEDAASEVSVDSGAADVWARLLEQKSVGGPADGDAEMADVEGSGPRLRARKQKVDYGAAADDAMDAGDDDEYVETPAPSVGETTAVHPNELAAVVAAHIDGILANYRGSVRYNGQNRPPNWDELILRACGDLCQPAPQPGEVQWTAPVLFFAMLTDLRLARGARLPSQPRQYEPCLLCRAPSHGSGYCPRICDPRLIASVARIKGLPDYWAHQAFHRFIAWYSHQYTWFVLGDPRGQAVNEQNKRTYPSYTCSAETYCQNIRAERRSREAERLRVVVDEARRRAMAEIGTTLALSAAEGRSSVDICGDVGSNMAVSSGFRPLSLETDLGSPMYSQLLAGANTQGDSLPTDVAALGPEHLATLLKARSKLAAFYLQMRAIAQSLISAGLTGEGRVPAALIRAAEQVRLLALHGRRIEGRINELRETLPAADFDRIVADTTLDRPPGAQASMGVDAPASEAMAVDGTPEPIAEVPEPSADSGELSAGRLSSDSVVPSVGEFDESGGAHGVRLAVGKLFQAQCLIAGRVRGSEPGEGTKRALMAALSEARAVNLRELERAAMARPALHGILPAVRRLAELEADPSSSAAEKDAEMSASLRELVKWVKGNVCDVRSVVPTNSGYGVDIALAEPLNSPVASASLAGPVQRPQAPPTTRVVHSAASAQSASGPGLPTTHAAIASASACVSSGPTLSAQAMPRAQQPAPLRGRPVAQPTPSMPLPVANAVLADSRRGNLTANALGLVASSSPLPVQPRPVPSRLHVPAPYGGQIINISSSPDSTPPLPPPQVCYRPPMPPPLGGSMSANPLRHSPAAGMPMPQSQFHGQPPPMRRPSTSDLAMGLSQGYLTSLQSVSRPGVRPVLHNSQPQHPMPPLGFHQVSAGMVRQVTPQQLAMMAQQQHYYQPQATQLVTPISGNYEPVSGQMDVYSRQLMAAPWQMMPVQPMYSESGIVAASSDMSCVICNDPVHPTACCPFAGNISHLTRRRMAVEESTAIPPNMRDSMLDTIDKYMRNALNQR
ncbi:hypothetical protein LPJ60_001357 [Coemansia sp. RSA 2675]|nr:hypothetical protein LPJ60_001357 [Coemansia sp. RSA 2675]